MKGGHRVGGVLYVLHMFPGPLLTASLSVITGVVMELTRDFKITPIITKRLAVRHAIAAPVCRIGILYMPAIIANARPPIVPLVRHAIAAAVCRTGILYMPAIIANARPPIVPLVRYAIAAAVCVQEFYICRLLLLMHDDH